jgi:hypothetical protein
MENRMSVVVDLQVQKFTEDAKKAEQSIKLIEDALIEIRKKSFSASNEEIQNLNKDTQALNIALKEQRIALREANQGLKNRKQELAAAATAQADFTRQVTTSAQGITAINAVLDKFKAGLSNGGDELALLKAQLVDLQRLKYSDILNVADQKVLRQTIFETNIRIREQSQALKVQQAEAKKAEVASKQLGQAQQQFRSQVGSSNAVALEFNRIIQDAPFGIIGVGNNIQQLTANFAQLRAGSASTGAALKASLLSIVSPANLVLLGVSAITSLWTAYQLGAFDAIFANEKLSKSFKELANESQSATANASVELTKINALRSVIEDETIARDKRVDAIKRLQSEFPAIFGDSNKELLLNGSLIKSYELLAKAIVQRAQASLAEKELPNLVRQKELVDAELKAKTEILATEKSLLETRNKLTPISQTFSGSDYEQAQRRIKDLEDSVSSLDIKSKGLKINIDGFTESIVSYSNEFQDLLEPVKENLGKVVKDVEYIDEAWNRFEDTTQRLAPKLQEIADKFNSIGQVLPTEAPVREVADEVPLGLVQSLQEQIDMYKKLRDAQTDISGFTKYNEEVKKLEVELKKLLGTGQEVQKLYATEALGGNPFAFLIDSIFKFQEVKSSLDDFADGSVEKMNLLREQAVLTGNIFSGLGDVFASVFASGNRELGQFISALGDFIGQLVVFAKIQQQASAAVVAAKQTEATAAGISAAAQTAASKGPAAFYTLAPLIASAVALVGSAFRGLGGARNTGGRSSATSSASLNTVGSAFAGFGATANPFGDLTLRASIRGTDIELLLERTTVKNRA